MAQNLSREVPGWHRSPAGSPSSPVRPAAESAPAPEHEKHRCAKLASVPTFMRQLSKRTQYSLRALYALTRGYGRGPILISQLAEEEAIPKKFLEQILLSLKTRGLVSSKPGRGGGYTLAQPPSQITLASVIRMIDGPLAPLPCASETRFRKCDECVDIDTCGTRMVMKEVRDAVAEILERTTLASVCRQVDAARQKQQDPKLLAYEI